MGLNIREPSWCTPTHGGLSNGTKSTMGGSAVWGDLNVTNKPPCLITDIDVCERDHGTNKPPCLITDIDVCERDHGTNKQAPHQR